MRIGPAVMAPLVGLRSKLVHAAILPSSERAMQGKRGRSDDDAMPAAKRSRCACAMPWRV
jgi:hypothetical protein